MSKRDQTSAPSLTALTITDLLEKDRNSLESRVSITVRNHVSAPQSACQVIAREVTTLLIHQIVEHVSNYSFLNAMKQMMIETASGLSSSACLRIHRISMGLTLADVADYMAIGERTLWNFENSISVPEHALVKRFEKLLEIPKGELHHACKESRLILEMVRRPTP